MSIGAETARCSVLAREAGEPLAGSAPRARAWLVVEQPGPYGFAALTESHLPAAVRDRLGALPKDVGTTVLLARRVGRHADDHAGIARRRFWFAHVAPGGVRMRSGLLDDSEMVRPDLATASIETFMRHFEYCAELVGIDAVTFGPDTFFGDHAGSYGIPSGALLASGDSEYDSVVPDYVAGLENIGEYPNIVRWLVKHGYSDAEIAKATGGNTLRVLEAAWAR